MMVVWGRSLKCRWRVQVCPGIGAGSTSPFLLHINALRLFSQIVAMDTL